MYIGFRLDKSVTLNMRAQRSAIVSCHEFLFHIAYVLWFCNKVGWAWLDWSLILRILFSFVLLPIKPAPGMTFNVYGWTFNHIQPTIITDAQSLYFAVT